MKTIKKQQKKKQHKKAYSNNNRHSGEEQSDDSRIDSGRVRSSLARMTLSNIFIFLFLIFLPTQLGKHFFFDFSYISGIRVDYLAPTLYVTDILVLLLIMLNIKTVITSFLQKKVLMVFFLLLLTVLFAQNQLVSIYRYIKLFELAGVFFILRKNKPPIKILLSAFTIGGVFELSLAVAQFVSKHSLQGIFYFFGERPLSLSMPGIAKASLQGIEILRPYATFSHPNSLGGFYLLLYFFVLTRQTINGSLIKPGTVWYLAKNLLLLVSTILVFLSFSKIAIGTYLFLNIIYLWKSPLRKHCTFCFVSRILVISIVSLLFFQAHADPLTVQKRVILIENAVTLIKQHPVIGVGLGNYIAASGQFSAKYLDLLNQPVHNVMLLLLSELGIVFVVILLIAFYKEIKSFIQKFPYIVVVILITGFFDHYWLTLQQNIFLLITVMGVIL